MDTRGAAHHGIRLVALSAVFCLCQRAEMQDEGGVKLRTSTRVVEVDVSVLDSSGKPVDDLTRADFTILDDGKPRAFTLFNVNRAAATPASVSSLSTETSTAGGTVAGRPTLPPNTFTNIGTPALPTAGHSTAIVLDAINGWFDNYAWARQGVIGLLSKVPADERIALYVISKNEGLVLLQDYTLDRERLLEAVSKYIPRAMCPAPFQRDSGEGMLLSVASSAPPPPEADSAEADRARRMAAMKAVTLAPPCVTPDRMQSLMHAGAESVRLSLNALAEQLSRQPGRKSIFFVSQGISQTDVQGEGHLAWDKTIAALNDANVAVNVVDSNGLGGPRRMWGRGTVLSMIQLAQSTGGQAFYGRNDLDAAMAAGIEASRSSYVLGFYLTEVDGRYHELKVHVARPGVALSYRQGYFALDEPKIDASRKKSDLASALLNPANSGDVGIVASLDVQAGTPRKTVNTRVRLDPDTLSLTPNKTGWNGKVEEMFVELNAGGHEVGRISATESFNVTAATKASYEKNGVSLVQKFQLAADAVKLEIIVRDTASGRTGTLAVGLDSVIEPASRK